MNKIGRPQCLFSSFESTYIHKFCAAKETGVQCVIQMRMAYNKQPMHRMAISAAVQSDINQPKALRNALYLAHASNGLFIRPQDPN